MLGEKQQVELNTWRKSATVEERRLAALEMIADQLAFIDARLFQIQGMIRFPRAG